MRKTILLIITIFFVISAQSFGQRHYKIKNVKEKGEFIVPPKTYWGYKQDGSQKHRNHLYYYIHFHGIISNYHRTLENLNFTDFWSGNTDYFLTTKSTKALHREFKIISETIHINKAFKFALLDNGSSEFLIQVDYDYLINTVEIRDQIVSNFKELAKDLLIQISSNEIAYNWPISISQMLVEKVFELMPVPQEASLVRYGWNVTSQSSFLPLNPKIALNIDISSLSASKLPPGEHWYYTLLSQTKIKFYRDNNGRIRQLPFIQFDENTMPSNSFIGKADDDKKDPNTVLLNNSGDLQLSDNSKSQNFIALFQNYMKQNSSYSTNGSDDDNLTLQTNRYAGNSILLLNTKLDLLLNGINEVSNVKAAYNSQGFNFRDTRDEKYSRTLITPVIDIFLNNTPLTINLGSSISTVNQQYNFGSQFSIYRSFNGKYVKIKNRSSSTILLPGDKIIF